LRKGVPMSKNSDQFRQLIESLPDAFAYHRAIYDQNGKPADYTFLEVNNAFEEMTGLERKNVVDRKVSEVLPGIRESNFDWIDIYGRLALEGGTIRFENYSDSLQRYYEVTAYSNEKYHFVAIFRDITSNKQREMELRNYQKRFSQAQLFANMGTWEYIPAEGKLYWSDECAELFGIKPGEFQGSFEAFLDFVHPEDRDYVIQTNQPAVELKEGMVLNYEHRIVKKDGAVRWVREEAGPVSDEVDKIIKMVGMVIDITVQKDAEAELRAIQANLENLVIERTCELEEKNRALEQSEISAIKSKKRVADILRHAENVSFVTTDVCLPEPRILDFSYGAEQIFGYKKEEVLGKSVSILHTPEDVEQFPAIIEVMKNNQSGFSGESTLVRKNGEQFPALFKTHPLFDEQGNISGTFGVSIDISDRKLAEEGLAHTLEIYRKGLEGIIASMGTLMSKRDNYTAGHQLRVAKLAVAIAEELGLEENKIEGLKLAAEVHDIGKIGIPAEILTKPDELTDLEYMIIQTHPRTGYEILQNIDFPWPLADIIAQHHEKIDGSGYPEGLAGDQILLEAKIICLADVVEAMASHRPYRASRGIAVALEEIERQRGILFDVEVVDACLKLFREKGFTLEH